MEDLATYLDNPVWYALTGPHAVFAEGDEWARCYPSDVSWGAAVRTEDTDAYESLARLMPPGRPFGLFGTPPPLTTRWRVLQVYRTPQMVCERPVPAPTDRAPALIPLTAADVPAMMQLVELAQPGPLLPRDIDLGPFHSIWDEGQLVAMAGVRFHVPGGREISTVCTHPAYRRRGYGRLLVQAVAHRVQQDGDIPFLHVNVHNHNAIALYASLGFRLQATLPLTGLERL
jgi:ribosomal protein S18 acetylase RimI-like enzyme